MPSQNVESLIDRWMNDTAFRAALRQDPEDAVRRAGVRLDDDELAALRAIDWSLTDEQLTARASKLFA